jgi:hypothetical protein
MNWREPLWCVKVKYLRILKNQLLLIFTFLFDLTDINCQEDDRRIQNGPNERVSRLRLSVRIGTTSQTQVTYAGNPMEATITSCISRTNNVLVALRVAVDVFST